MKRVSELDTYRGLAAVAIVFFHYSHATPAYAALGYASGVALELFFVLSGYLITSIILKYLDGPFLLPFYARRALRIFPAYFLVVGLFTLIVLLRPGLGSIHALPWYLTFSQFTPHYWGAPFHELAYYLEPTWSVAVEQQFYIFWPLILWAFGRRALAPMAIACLVISPLARMAGYHPWLLLTHADGFAMGGLLAGIIRDSEAAKATRSLVPGLVALGLTSLGGLVACSISTGQPFLSQLGGRWAWIHVSLVSAMFASLLGLTIVFSGSAVLAPLRARWLIYLGTISYGIYLYHLPSLAISLFISSRMGLPSPITLCVIAPSITLLAAAISWRFLEEPILSYSHRFPYGSARASRASRVNQGADPMPGLTASR